MFTEFFCGIGGLAACLPHQPTALSIDINRKALAVHSLNFRNRQLCKAIESLTAESISDAPRKFWWMSPPCQPYSRRGKQRDVEDPRSAGFLNMLKLIDLVQPENLGMENVPEFGESRSRQRLIEVLKRAGYHFAEITVCSTQFGCHNRRRRYYLVASQEPLADWKDITRANFTPKLEPDVEFEKFAVPEVWLDSYDSALHIVDETPFLAGAETTICFTSAYGRSPVYSGSMLRTGSGLRMFTPLEILWQHGFPDSFRLPDWSPERLWPLTGNTLSLPAIKYLLQHLPIHVPPSPVQRTG